MSIEQLLNPRYKVIADYPASIFKVGEILYGHLIYCDNNGPKYSDWPHLFKPLQWWEERKIEEMPAYVKQEGRVDSKDRPIPDRVVKITVHWARSGMHPHGSYKLFFSPDILDSTIRVQHYHDWQPATESEYLTHINSK